MGNFPQRQGGRQVQHGGVSDSGPQLFVRARARRRLSRWENL